MKTLTSSAKIGFIFSVILAALMLSTRPTWALVGAQYFMNHARDNAVCKVLTKKKDGVSICTGALIDPETILTAGHCFSDENFKLAPDLRVTVTCNYASRTAKEVIIHPDFSAGPEKHPQIPLYDFALVKLDRVFGNFRPLEIATKHDSMAEILKANSHACYIGGAGRDRYNQAGHLRFLPALESDLSTSLFSENPRQIANIAEGELPGYVQIFQPRNPAFGGLAPGDSGGPLLCVLGKPDRIVLFGVSKAVLEDEMIFADSWPGFISMVEPVSEWIRQHARWVEVRDSHRFNTLIEQLEGITEEYGRNFKAFYNRILELNKKTADERLVESIHKYVKFSADGAPTVHEHQAAIYFYSVMMAGKTAVKKYKSAPPPALESKEYKDLDNLLYHLMILNEGFKRAIDEAWIPKAGTFRRLEKNQALRVYLEKEGKIASKEINSPLEKNPMGPLYIYVRRVESTTIEIPPLQRSKDDEDLNRRFFSMLPRHRFSDDPNPNIPPTTFTTWADVEIFPPPAREKPTANDFKVGDGHRFRVRANHLSPLALENF